MFFSLALQKRQAVLSFFEVSRTGRTEASLRTHSAMIARITGSPPDAAKQVVWRLPGSGWANEPTVPWRHLETIEALVATLTPLLLPDAQDAAEAGTHDLGLL